MKDWGRRSTARAARSATTCRSWAAAASSPSCARPRARPTASSRRSTPSGETLFQLFSVPGHACQAIVPAEATVFARRVPIPLFGAGLVEAILDDAILALEDPDDRDGNGVSGRAARVLDLATGQMRVGRFGWKAQHATLLTFGADAYRNEMGITNDIFATELAVGVSDDRMRVCDPIPDPEDVADPATRRRGIDNFASFMRLPRHRPRGASDGRPRSGEQIFDVIGCTACHVPKLPTGSESRIQSSIAARSRSSRICCSTTSARATASCRAPRSANEIRTPALWGLRFRRPLLHDGTAATPDDAIRRHAGEAALARAGVRDARRRRPRRPPRISRVAVASRRRSLSVHDHD